jgi:hypothetical protein
MASPDDIGRCGNASRRRTDQLAIPAGVRDQHDGRVLMVVMGARRGGFAERSKALGESRHLIFLQSLAREHNDRKLVPGVENVVEHGISQ